MSADGDRDPEVAGAEAVTDGWPERLPDATGPQASGLAERLLSSAFALAAFLGLLTTVIWGLTGGGNYWPRWVWLGCGGIVALLAAWVHVRSLPQDAHGG